MLKDYQLRQMYQLLTENSVEGKRSTSITGLPLGKNKRSVDKRKVCLFVFFKSYNFFLIQTMMKIRVFKFKLDSEYTNKIKTKIERYLFRSYSSK